MDLFGVSWMDWEYVKMSIAPAAIFNIKTAKKKYTKFLFIYTKSSVSNRNKVRYKPTSHTLFQEERRL